MQSMGMTKAISPFLPSSPLYYDGADVLGFIFHNPLAAQARLASYPAFLALSEKKEFKSLEDDKFQQFWLEGHSFGDLVSNSKIQPLFESPEVFTNVLSLLNGDLKDLKGYLETGNSAKYDEEKILGRWFFDYKESMARIRRAKAGMTLEEIRRTRAALGRMVDANLTAMVDHQANLKMPSMSAELQWAKGTWKDNSPGKYTLSLADREKKLELEATAESNKLLVSKDGYSLVFEK
jgi:hypothetical protein